MSKILSLDTSTDACSVAVYDDGAVIDNFAFIPRLHSQQLLPMIDKLLAQSGLSSDQLDAIAYGCGPGSFTGIRIANSVAQGIAFGLTLPVIPVSTLAAMAQSAISEYGSLQIISCLDARLHEIYWGAYRAVDGMAVFAKDLMAEERVGSPEQISELFWGQPGNTWVGAGNGWRYHDRLGIGLAEYYADIYPHAKDIALLAALELEKGNIVSPENAFPVYLRNDVVKAKTP